MDQQKLERPKNESNTGIEAPPGKRKNRQRTWQKKTMIIKGK